jgi:hypothetical protein
MDIFECRSCGREIVIIIEPCAPTTRFGRQSMVRKNKSVKLAAIHRDDLKHQQLAQRRHRMSYKVRARLEDKCRGERERAA